MGCGVKHAVFLCIATPIKYEYLKSEVSRGAQASTYAHAHVLKQPESIFPAASKQLISKDPAPMARNVPGEPYTRISAEEANEMVNSGGATIIDVRRDDEWAGGHATGALWIPVDDVIPRFDELPAEGSLLFICEVGARSGLAAEYAAAMGAQSDRLFNVEDGTGTWIQKGLPHSTGDDK